MLSRKSSLPAPAKAPAIVHEVLNSPGQALDNATRAFMEPRFGHDFSKVPVSSGIQAQSNQLRIGTANDRYEREADDVADRVSQGSEHDSARTKGTSTGFDFSKVRIHTDARAAESARAVNAIAYTVGNNVVFDSGHYSPATTAGRRLLAHELTHVAQQDGAGTGATTIQRTVREDNVDCNPPNTTDGAVVGANPLGTLRRADRDAIEMLTNAYDDLVRTRARILEGAPIGFPAIAERTYEGIKGLMRMDPENMDIWTGTGSGSVWVLARRLEIVRNLLLSGRIEYHCRSSTTGGCGFGCIGCGGGPCCTDNFACSCDGIFHNFLCDMYWGQSTAGLTSSIMHEPFHMSFEFIGDSGRLANAHCYTRLAFWLNGRDVPVDRRSRCPLAK